MKYIPIIYKGKEYRAIVDDEDYPEISKHKWYTKFKDGKISYAYRREGAKKCIFMHLCVLPKVKGKEVDHINRNRLDNRRANLRLCTRSQNLGNSGMYRNNTSGYKGVSMVDKGKSYERWEARIMFNYKLRNIGSFKTAEEAARAYNKKARELFGEFAYQNIIT